MGITPRPKSIRTLQEIHLKHRFQYARDRPLQQAIFDRGDSQRKLHMNTVSLWGVPRSSILFTPFGAKAFGYLRSGG